MKRQSPLPFDEIRVGGLYEFLDIHQWLLSTSGWGAAPNPKFDGKITTGECCVILDKKLMGQNTWIKVLNPDGVYGWCRFWDGWWAEP